MTFSETFEEVLSAFNEHKVDYMLVGGFAVNFYGYNRSTNDLDIWVKPTPGNQHNIFNALKQMGFTDDGLEQFLQLDFMKPFVFSIGRKPLAVEIFNVITGVKYEDAEPHKIRFSYDNQFPVYFISLKDLIVNKMLSGRPKDNIDIEELQKIEMFKKG